MVPGKGRGKQRRPDRFVLDCSIVFAWYFADDSDSYADTIARRLSTAVALVPMLWPLEVANTLVMGERRKRSTEAQATHFLAYVSALPIEVDDQTTRLAWSRIISIARTHHLSSYDASYLELAMRLGLPIATLDDQLKAAAAGAGISVYLP